MSRARAFLVDSSQAGVFHVVSRIYDRKYLMGEEEKAFFLEAVRAYEELLGVEVLTFCVMSNHFHLLVRVPHRPEGFDVCLEVLVSRLERASGKETFALLRKKLALWERTGDDEARETWRRRQVGRMFSLSEFMKCVKFRFSCWYNKRVGREGTLWDGRFTSVLVAEEERALRTVAAYIDLNPVRAGMVGDPGDYRWSGYAEAMEGKARARRGLVRIIGQVAWRRAEAAGARPWSEDTFAPEVERRALLLYRALLGAAGAERRRADGTVARVGMSDRVRARLMSGKEGRLAAEVLGKRVPQFTRGMVLGSRDFVDGWFERNRFVVQGSSREGRQRGARSLGQAALRGLYAFRDSRGGFSSRLKEVEGDGASALP
jgi:REP element-mobilizing transposase RayT